MSMTVKAPAATTATTAIPSSSKAEIEAPLATTTTDIVISLSTSVVVESKNRSRQKHHRHCDDVAVEKMNSVSHCRLLVLRLLIAAFVVCHVAVSTCFVASIDLCQIAGLDLCQIFVTGRCHLMSSSVVLRHLTCPFVKLLSSYVVVGSRDRDDVVVGRTLQQMAALRRRLLHWSQRAF